MIIKFPNNFDNPVAFYAYKLLKFFFPTNCTDFKHYLTVWLFNKVLNNISLTALLFKLVTAGWRKGQHETGKRNKNFYHIRGEVIKKVINTTPRNEKWKTENLSRDKKWQKIFDDFCSDCKAPSQTLVGL